MRRPLAVTLGCALAGVGGGGAACSSDGGGGSSAATQAASADTGVTTEVADPTEGEMVPLTLAMAWQPVPASQDPLAAHRPEDVSCPLGGWLYEPQGLEINTARCNYAMFGQPAQVAVVAGARLTASVYHFDLIAEAPATAHVALLLGDRLVWEEDIAIPGKANAYTIDLTLPFAVEAGTPVYFHLHNHGQNTWTVGAIEGEVFAPGA